MRNKAIGYYWLALVVLIGAPQLNAQIPPPLSNGDFDLNLSAWQVRGMVVPLTDETGQPYVLLQEPGQGAASEIWQTFSLPTSSQRKFLSFRYRFLGGASLSRPSLIAAVSRRSHGGGVGDVDIDVFAGQTEPRAAAGTILPSFTTTMRIFATFNKRVALLGLPSGDITTDRGTISQTTVDMNTVDLTISDLPHAAQVNLAFPGVADDVFRRREGGSDSRLCIAQVTGDYDNNGQFTSDDGSAVPDGPATPETVRADWNLDGLIDAADRAAVQNAGLLDGPRVVCPPPVAGSGSAGTRPKPGLPPDSFTAFLLKESSLERPTGLTLSAPLTSFTPAFYYEDGNGVRIYDPDAVTVTSIPDSAGMLNVSLNISSVSDSTARVVFALATADNGMESAARADSVFLECPPVSSGWCCNPQTGLLQTIDDDDVCTDDVCDTTTGVMSHTPVAPSGTPHIQCPSATYADATRPSTPDYTGWATTNETCGSPTIDYSDDIHVGCPTVINRMWTVTVASAASSCVQAITDLNSASPFYRCLEDRLRECLLRDDGTLIIALATRVYGVCQTPGLAVTCSCSLAEVATECFKDVVKGELPTGQLQSCIAHTVNEWIAAGVMRNDDGGDIKSCTANNIHALYDWITGLADPNNPVPGNFTACDGGPIGTEPCLTSSDCAADYDPTTTACCIGSSGTAAGWCEQRTTGCP